MNSLNNDIVSIEQSHVEQRSPETTRQYKIVTLNADRIEAMLNDDDSITESGNISTNRITSYWSKHPSFRGTCAFAVFISIAMTIGIMTVCFTSQKKINGTCQLNFNRTVEPATGYDSRPRYVAVGDFNKDSYLDIVVANSGTDNIDVLLGYGNRTFASQITYSTGITSHPYSVAAGDFNSDTLLDVVVVNYGTNSIGVLRGDGNGTFATPIITSLGSSRPLSLAVADFNNDKQLDVAVVNYGTSSVSVLLGTNNGSFRIDQTFHIGYDSVPYSLAVTDLNQDNQIDIVVVNYGTSTLVTLLADGNGTFISYQYSTGHGSHPSSVAVGDYNNDAILDIAVTNSGSSNIGVFLGYGNGFFTNMMIQPLDSSSSPQFIAVSDFDNDNRLDLIVADSGNNNVVVLKGHGNGSFSLITTHSTGYNSDPRSIVVGDFDNDNRSDIAIVNDAINSILVLTSYATHLNTAQMTYSTGTESSPQSVAVGDFDQDDHLDIVVANSKSNNIGIFFGLGNGRFERQEIVYTKNNSAMNFVVVGDFDNDNQSDIVFLMTGISKMGILLGDENGSFRNEQTYSTGDDSSPQSVALGDLNNDGNLDIIVANYRTKNAGIFYGYGDGSFTKITTFFIRNNFYPVSIGVGDFNNDNILDIVVTNFKKNDIVILEGYGNGSYFTSMIVSNGDGYSPYISIGDLNKDNHLDIVYTSPLVSTIGILLGYGNGTFESVIRYYTGSGAWPWSVTLCDFNNDTLLDIAISNAYDYNMDIFFGSGNGSFAAQQTFSTGYGSHPTGIAVGDFNGDHLPDIVVGNQNTNNIGVFLAHHDADFTVETSYFTGSGPHQFSVAAGDFDKNWQSDIVVANSGNDNIQILLGYNKGVFMSNRTYSTGFSSAPQFVTVADFNKDTQLDIAVANVGNDSINVFVGFGNGTFDTPTVHLLDSGSSSCSIAVGDLNNDSWIDMVIANQGNDNVGVFLGFDYPTFTNETIDVSGLSPQPAYVAVGDFNHDQHWDIVVANVGVDDNIGVFLGYGDGTFAEQVSYSTGISSNPKSIAVGDFNNDTHLDVVVANSGTNTIGIFLGYGNGSFRAQITYSTGDSSYTLSVAVCDLNKDNTLDIVVANRDSNSVGVFLGYGNGTFATQVPYSMPDDSSTTGVAVGDLNNDSISDIVMVDYANDNIGILQGYGDGTFSNVTTYSTEENSGPSAVAIGDLNKDRWMDIAVACDEGIGVFFGYGNGTFSSQATYSTGSQSDLYAIIIADLNNDTLMDIAVADYGTGDGNIGVLYGYGDGNFTVLKIYSTGLSSDPSSVATCDFNNDGRVDLAISYKNDDRIGLMLRSKSEPFATLATFSTGYDSRPSSVAVNDFNNDNQLDIAVANSGTNNIGILLGHGDGAFTQQLTYSTGNNSLPVSIAVGYINDDNQPDIVVANSNTNNILIFLGSHDGTFAILTTYSTGPSSVPSSIVVNDLNKDNHLDIVVSTYGTNKLFVFFGFGNGSFFEPKSYSLGYNARPQSLTIGDFNNDTLLDIAVANSVTDYVEILLQTC